MDNEITKKKSSIGAGKGTMIIAKIETIKITIVRSFDLTIGSKKGATLVSKVF